MWALTIDGHLGCPARHGPSPAMHRSRLVRPARPNWRTGLCRASPRVAYTAQARPNTTWAVPGRSRGTKVYHACSQKKSIFVPSTLQAVFKGWLENKSILYISFLGLALYDYISLFCIPTFFIWSGRAGPAHRAEGAAQAQPGCRTGPARARPPVLN